MNKYEIKAINTIVKPHSFVSCNADNGVMTLTRNRCAFYEHDNALCILSAIWLETNNRIVIKEHGACRVIVRFTGDGTYKRITLHVQRKYKGSNCIYHDIAPENTNKKINAYIDTLNYTNLYNLLFRFNSANFYL